MDEVVSEAKQAVHEVRMFGMFETMKYLACSGRVNKTIIATSSILRVMPLLTFHEGEIVRAGLVWAGSKGADKIYDFVKRTAPVKKMMIVHSQVIDQAKQLKHRIGELIQEKKYP